MFDGSRPVNSRVLNVTIRCIECDVPKYEPLELDKYYKVVSQSFIGTGGDGFTVSNSKIYNTKCSTNDGFLIIMSCVICQYCSLQELMDVFECVKVVAQL